MGLDCESGYTKGRCWNCQIIWFWESGKIKVKNTKCPKCGGILRYTTHYCKSAKWIPLPIK